MRNHLLPDMVYFYKAFGLTFSSEIYLSECTSVAESVSIDFSIVKACIDCPPLQVTNIHRRGIMAQSGRGVEDELYLHWEGVATYKAMDGKVLEVHSFTDDASLLSLFTVSEALGMILFQRHDYLLHASAVQVGRHAFVIMGAPGAGKSTTAAAFVKAGCPLLSDDLTAIRFDAQQIPYVVPAYPQLKIWSTTVNGLGWVEHSLERISEGVNKYALSPTENFPEEPIPLSHILFIEKHEQAGFVLENVSPLLVPIETLKHFPLEDEWLLAEDLTRLFHQSISCAKQATLWHVKRPVDFNALEEWVQMQIEQYG